MKGNRKGETKEWVVRDERKQKKEVREKEAVERRREIEGAGEWG